MKDKKAARCEGILMFDVQNGILIHCGQLLFFCKKMKLVSKIKDIYYKKIVH